MSRKISIVLCVFLFLLGLLAVTSNNAQSQQVQETKQSNSDVQPFGNLTLEISSPAQSTLPLEPIPLIIRQSNKTTKQVLGYEKIGFGQAPISLFVRKVDANEKVEFCCLTGLFKYIIYKNFPLEPGFSYESKEWVALGLNTYVPEPGSYELQATLGSADATQEIQSNIINIEIREPTGVDREVYNLIKNNPARETLFAGFDFGKEKTTLETIKNRFPNSAYARSAYYALGKSYLSRKQYGQALVNLLKLENDKDFIHAEKVKERLAEIREAMQTTKSNK